MRPFTPMVVLLAVAPPIAAARAPAVPAEVTELCDAQAAADRQACARCGASEVRALRSCDHRCFAKYPEILNGAGEPAAAVDLSAASARDACLDTCRTSLETRVTRCISAARNKSRGKRASGRATP